MTDTDVTRETQMFIADALTEAKETGKTMIVGLLRVVARHWPRVKMSLSESVGARMMVEAICYPDGHVETDCEWPPATLAESMLTADANH
jgi:hypothetical protein